MPAAFEEKPCRCDKLCVLTRPQKLLQVVAQLTPDERVKLAPADAAWPIAADETFGPFDTRRLPTWWLASRQALVRLLAGFVANATSRDDDPVAWLCATLRLLPAAILLI